MRVRVRVRVSLYACMYVCTCASLTQSSDTDLAAHISHRIMGS